VTNSGNVDVTLTGLMPQATITVGFGIGQPTRDRVQPPFLFGERPGRKRALGDDQPGSYCVSVYGIGNIQGSDSYMLTVTHP
jgi:hypothetical protein